MNYYLTDLNVLLYILYILIEYFRIIFAYNFIIKHFLEPLIYYFIIIFIYTEIILAQEMLSGAVAGYKNIS